MQEYSLITFLVLRKWFLLHEEHTFTAGSKVSSSSFF